MFFRLTPVVKILLIINFAVYFAANLLFGSIMVHGASLHYWIIDALALQPIGDSMSQCGFGIWQLITYQFLHADFGHIFFNMFTLFMFSPELEERWGSVKFLAFYLLAGIGAGLLHMAISPLLGHPAPTIGASGAIYGIIIAFAMSNPDRKIFMFPIFIPIPAKLFGIGMMVLSVLIGISSTDGIAHFAHFGGALTGLLLLKYGEKTPIFKVLRRKLHFGIEGYEFNDNNYNNYYGNFGQQSQKSGYNIFNQFNQQTEDQEIKAEWINPNEQKQTTSNKNKFDNLEIDGVKISQEMVDKILDKITSDGYQSLTEQEKYIITTISKML